MRSAFVMDGDVVPTVVVDAYRARPGLSAPRHNWKDEYIKTITDWARHTTPQPFAPPFSKNNVCCDSEWVSHCFVLHRGRDG